MQATDYIAQRLAREGITHAFLVQGAANNDLIYSIADTPGIEYVCAQHEQCAGFMAEGWSKVTGKPGVAIVTSGPGGQNLVTAIANCYYDSVPAVFITGQVNSRFMRPSGSGLRQIGFQEWPASDVIRPITKHSELVLNAKHVPYALDHALWLCRNKRPGPVHLDIPLDVQKAEIPDNHYRFGPPTTPIQDITTLLAKMDSLARDLKRSLRPVLLVGGGCRNAILEVQHLAYNLGVPAFPTWNALDIIYSDFDLYGGRVGTYGGAGRNFAIQNCDLLIGIGTRLSGRITGGNLKSFARGARRYVVDVDPALLERENQQVPFDISIEADAGAFCNHFSAVWNTTRTEPGGNTSWGDWLERVFYWRDRYAPATGIQPSTKTVHPYLFARELSRQAATDAIIVSDCGGNAVVMSHAFQTKQGQRFFSNHGNSPMGFALSGAIGSAFAAGGQRQVICVIGDGGLHINIQELQTLKHYDLPVKIFLVNNGIYGITRAFQEHQFPDHVPEASGPRGYSTPSFYSVARAYTLPVILCTNDVVCSASVGKTLDIPGPAVCLMECPEFHAYTPAIRGWATPIEDMTPLLPREEFRANMIGVEPLPGWESGEYQ